MKIARTPVAVELDLDAPMPEPMIASRSVEIETDLFKKKRQLKPKPEEEARDAMPRDRNRIGWWKAPSTTLPGHTVGFAYAKSKNEAGFYVSFTIIWKGRAWNTVPTRSNMHGWKTKRAAMDYCLDRQRDAQRPKRERRYVITAP